MKHLVIKTSVVTTVAGVVMVLGILAALMLGPIIETWFKPVFVNIKGTVVKASTPGSMEILVTAHKVRDCDLSAMKADVFDKELGRWVEGTAQMVQLSDGDKLLPLDQQRVPEGTVVVRRIRITPAGERVTLHAEAKCHIFWTTKNPPAAIENMLVPN